MLGLYLTDILRFYLTDILRFYLTDILRPYCVEIIAEIIDITATYIFKLAALCSATLTFPAVPLRDGVGSLHVCKLGRSLLNCKVHRS